MTEAAAAPQSSAPVWERYRIGLISSTKKGKFIRLIDDLKHTNDEYPADDLDLTQYRSNDLIDVRISGAKIVDHRIPPGMEPVSNTQVHTGKPSTSSTPAKPVEQPKPAPAKAATTSPEITPIKTLKPRPPHIMMIGNGFVIIAGTPTGELKFTLVEKALQYIKSFKEGDLVNFSCIGKDKIKSMWKVDENGERPPKNTQYQQPGQSQRQSKIVSLGGIINVGNFENLKIEVSGPYESIEDVKKYKEELSRISSMFGGNDQIREVVHGFCDRVIGGK